MVTHATTRSEALATLTENKFYLTLINISLLDRNSFTELNMGSDDYITKPFRQRELIVRIGTTLRKVRHFRTDGT